MRTKSEKNAVKEVLDGMQPVVEMADAVAGVEQPTSDQQPKVDAFDGISGEINPEEEKEIAPGMTVEEIKAEYFNEDALQEQPEPVYRLDSSGHRYYYTFDENGEPIFYVSVTTLIKQTLPTSPQLIKWIADMGYEESQRYAQERAAYGTFLHSQIAEYLIAKSYDLSTIKEKLKLYVESEKLPIDFISYSDDIKMDLLSFAQFVHDVDLKPLAIELVLTNPQDGYAGAIDLCAEITIEEKGFFGDVYKTGTNAGKPKETKRQRRIRAIIDFKSGRKGFFPEHEVQLLAYKTMWNMHFEKYPVEKVFNWAPKSWIGEKPTYHFKDQTDSKNAKKLPYLVELARIEDEKRDNDVIFCSGIIDMDKPDLSSNITKLSLSEVVKKRKRVGKIEECDWKDIPGYEGKYQANRNGQIRGLIDEYGRKRDEPYILKPQKEKTGYYHVNLNGVTKRVHVLIALTFLGAPPENMEVNHKDEDKGNNSIDNLEYITHRDNINYGTRNQRTSDAQKGIPRMYARRKETANEPDLRPSESETEKTGTDIPKEKEKPVKPKKTAKDKQKENISALLNGDDEL